MIDDAASDAQFKCLKIIEHIELQERVVIIRFGSALSLEHLHIPKAEKVSYAWFLLYFVGRLPVVPLTSISWKEMDMISNNLV
jgi:hypothetical protein